MSLLTLRNVTLSLGPKPLLNKINITIEAGQRLCVIGRNGVGKSTFFKLLSGGIDLDSGDIEASPNLRVSQLIQDIPRDLTGTIYEVVSEGLGKIGQYLTDYHALSDTLNENSGPSLLNKFHDLQQKIDALGGWDSDRHIESILSKMKLDPNEDVSQLSGGMIRRVLLAKALVKMPDILLLDEPTNHLDIEAIKWLEGFLQRHVKTLLFITHDRRLLQTLATDIIEIDRGKLMHWQCGYEDYLVRKEQQLLAEEKANQLFDKKLAEEERWIRQGIKARRTRNEGRVRHLKEMRTERKSRQETINQVKLQTSAVEYSGKAVFTLSNITFAINERPLINDFSNLISRGDKIGIIGPNGCGKSTFIKLLLGELSPLKGTIKRGAQLSIRYFDQQREQLDLEKSAIDNVHEGSDTITINDKSTHVITYLRDFLFTPERARAPVKFLSGGERNRLLLARLFTKPANVLILDEPTNDLDIETLELLEERLSEYSGTLLLISHDREFLDNIVTYSFVFTGNGNLVESLGGYSDYLNRQEPSKTTKSDKKKPKKSIASPKLSYKEQTELKKIPKDIERLEKNIAALQLKMSDPDFFKQEQDEITNISTELANNEKQLENLYKRWDSLEGGM
jgi:ATP-binding cassette subfamily F protein uup